MSARPDLSAQMFKDKQSFLFDTNALWGLAGIKDWDGFLRVWADNSFTTAWIPWVLYEVTGTNLYDEGKGLTEKLLKGMQKLARRFEELAQGRVLPDLDHLLWADAHRMANVNVPPYPGGDHTEEHVRWLQKFLALRSASQVTIQLKPKSLFVGYRLEDDDAWKVELPFRFAEFGREVVEEVRAKVQSTRESPKEQVDEDIKAFARWWFHMMVTRLNIPDEVAKKASENGAFASSSWFKGLEDGYYWVRKAIGIDQKGLREGDHRDHSIGAYQDQATYLVTDDGRFCDQLRYFMASPERILRFKTFFSLMGMGPAASDTTNPPGAPEA